MLNINFTNENTPEKFGKILFVIGWLFLFLTSYIGLTKIGLWSDEFYSITLSKLPFDLMINYGMIDIHPMLYYIIYNFLVKILFFLDPTIIGVITSLIPFYLIGLLSFFKIKKQYNWLTAGIFFLCITSMPQLMLFAVEIRMYSWGLFFLTASFIYLTDILNEWKLRSWIILTVLTICSIYTHYFSLIGSIGIYILLLINIIINNRDKLKYWIVSSAICIVSYIPWISVVISQYKFYHEIFWIEPIHLRTLVSYVYSTFSPATIHIKSTELVSPTILGSILLICFIYLLYKEKDKNSYFALTTFLFVPIIGIIISKLVTPCFHPRYMIPVFGCLWLSFSILLGKLYYDNKTLFGIILCVVLIVGCVGTIDFIKIEEQEAINTELEFNSTYKVFGTNNIIFCDQLFINCQLEDYMIENDYYYNFNYKPIVKSVNQTLNDQDIQYKINNGSKVLYIGYGVQQLRDAGFQLEEYHDHKSQNMFDFKIYEIKGLTNMTN